MKILTTMTERRLDRLERLEKVLGPQLDEATAHYEAGRAERRRQVMREWPATIAGLEAELDRVDDEQRRAQAAFDRAAGAYKAADARLRAAMQASFGLSARRDRARVGFEQALGPLGNERLEEAITALALMRDNANTLTETSPKIRQHWFTKREEVLGLDVHTPGMVAVAVACEAAIAELEALRHSEAAPAEIEAAADAALERCRAAGGGAYRDRIGSAFESTEPPGGGR